MPVYILTEEIWFPDISQAEPEGLLATGGDLGADRLLAAYSSGIFPWYSEGEPILWWSPDPRMVLFPANFKTSHSLKQKLAKQTFIIKFDSSFKKVVDLCSSVDERAGEGTWITREMKHAYLELHRMGYAHSVESYYNGKLAGGLYGISLGRAFFGESMFHTMTDASKVALYYLAERLRENDFLFIDAQVESEHLVSLGAEMIPRVKYVSLLKKALKYTTIKGKWQMQGKLAGGSES